MNAQYYKGRDTAHGLTIPNTGNAAALLLEYISAQVYPAQMQVQIDAEEAETVLKVTVNNWSMAVAQGAVEYINNNN